ncbi:acyl-CoA dehydrogenase [Arenibacter sp. F26102]|uniref:acyl-CoA dehydrogenase n=1 Tax=Arenibacter sp. F26102 TaxID=2926416 RepID=UPI001FF66F25|nr:acyl-CoA dehydrogenase [Arenibacter sp. F26102]MCK0144933.1 acyl-CoA dehydrogenase [Arenibacter sp. F26102]
MIQVDKLQELRELCSGVEIFPKEVLDWIEEENLWSIWVPKTYGGLELSLTDGLHKLKALARIDASLGWTVTLCSGANYFVGNLEECKARDIFLNSKVPVCFGGSGGVSGTALICDDHYNISGKWHYATGAPYLTHFTLNAEILENGVQLRNDDGSPRVRSFVIPKSAVQVIEDWNTMGLKATATHSFAVKDYLAHKSSSFSYNDCYLPHPIFKIPFALFADLTLWINYIGIAEQLLEEAGAVIVKERLGALGITILESVRKIFLYASEIEKRIEENRAFEPDYMEEIHNEAVQSVKSISRTMIEIYPSLGVKASTKDHKLNQIFRDYFTATQHHIFTK